MRSTSLQHTLDRIRPPRVQITYDVETDGGVVRKKLPLVVGVLSDLGGHNKAQINDSTNFVNIDRDNFDEVLQAISPQLSLIVTRTIAQSTEVNNDKKKNDKKNANENASISDNEIEVNLNFTSFKDFSPESIVLQVPELNNIYIERQNLNNFLSKIEANNNLERIIADKCGNQNAGDDILGNVDKASDPDVKEILQNMSFGNGNADNQESDQNKSILKSFLKNCEINATQSPYQAIIQSIAKIDMQMSEQLDFIMHNNDFQKLEGSWRGLHYIVMSSETGKQMKIRVMNITKDQLSKDLMQASEFDQSNMFKKVYEDEYGTFGGVPYSVLIGDFEFGKDPQEIAMLKKIAGVAAAAHAPFLTAASSNLFSMPSFSYINSPRSLEKIFESSEMIGWNGFRDMEDARYVSMFLPQILMREPYGPHNLPADGFNYQEDVDGNDNSKFCWGNPAYAMGMCITRSFSLYSWTAAICGVENGGLVSNLPTYTFKTKAGDIAIKCPTQVEITDRREKELSDLGFIALCYCKGKDYAAFFGGQTIQRPVQYDTQYASANAKLSASLPYILTASRFVHYIKIMMREKIGSFLSSKDVESYLQNWLANYVLLSDISPSESKARYPLRQGSVKVKSIAGSPGIYQATIFIRPHFQLEGITVSMRLVTKIPALAK